jgi:hypothetical protein
MRGEDKEAWLNYKLPIMMALAAAQEPVPIDKIEEFSGVRERKRVITALQKEEWGQFLQVQGTTTEDKYYSLYHASFREFLSKKDELEEGVRLIQADLKIADSLLSKLHGGK